MSNEKKTGKRPVSSGPQNLRSYTRTGENLEENRVFNPSVYDMRLAHPAVHRVETAFDFGNHAARDLAAVDISLNFFHIEGRCERILKKHALDVSEKYELLRPYGLRDFSG